MSSAPPHAGGAAVAPPEGAGGSVGTTAALDFHARLAPRPGAYDRLLASMDELGIDRAVVCPGGVVDLDTLANQILVGGHVENDADNDAVLEASGRSGGRLMARYFANPHRPPDDYRARADAFVSVELSPSVHGVALRDPRNVAYVEAAGEAGHPVYTVCIERPGKGVDELVALAGAYPDITFVLGHCGFIGVDFRALSAVADSPNIVAETSGCYAMVAKVAVQRLGADRVLFGTEAPLQDPAVEVIKLRGLGLDPETERAVMRDNACRLLGLPADMTENRPTPGSTT